MEKTQLFVAERRKHSRHPIETQITVLAPEFWMTGHLNGLWGWTHNVSEGGVCFSLPERVQAPELVLHIDYEGMGAEYVFATVIKEQNCGEDGWRYHCQIERTLASISALASLQEESLDF